MSEPSVEEIVAQLAGTYIDDTWLAVRVDAIIADWRKLGEAAEEMRAKCFDVVAVEMEAWREAGHTDDGDLYAQAIAALGVLKPISERIADLKGNGEGK